MSKWEKEEDSTERVSGKDDPSTHTHDELSGDGSSSEIPGTVTTHTNPTTTKPKDDDD